MLCAQFVSVVSLGIQVRWTGTQLDITVADGLSQSGTVCGLCGNSDGNAGNDRTVGPSTACTRNIPGNTDVPGSVVSL